MLGNTKSFQIANKEQAPTVKVYQMIKTNYSKVKRH